MNESRLEKNLCGVVLEMALKMGLTASPLSLNYPSSSLCRMLEVSPAALPKALETFFAARAEVFDAVHVQAHEDGFCLTIPAEGVVRILSRAPAADWGIMINDAKLYYLRYAPVLLAPAACLTLFCLSIHLIADCLRDRLDYDDGGARML